MVPVSNMAFGKPAFDWVVFVFMLVCVIVMIVISLTPTMMVMLKNYRQGFNRSHLTIFHRHKATRMLLIISQSAIAMLLLAMSGMAARSYLDLFYKDIGIDDSSVLVTSAFYSWEIPDTKQVAIVHETLEALRSGNPDAKVAVYQGGNLFEKLTSMMPASYRFNNVPLVRQVLISPGFVRTVKGRLLAGREFNEKDRQGEVVLLNATLAGRLGWSPHEALGQIIESSGTPGQAATVVGVIGDFLNNTWEDDIVEPIVFEPITLGGNIARNIHIDYIVHPDVLRRTRNIEQIISKSAPETVIMRHTTWNKLLNSSASGKILASFIVVIFTIAAIVIVVTGIVNTVLFTITKRTREIAIHLALGAPTGRVFWFVTSDVVKAGITGLLFGVLVSWWIGKASAHFFYNGVQYHGLLELMTVAILMLLIIIVASLIPALRILRIEISRALVFE
jgi:hypothetical protein